MKKFILPLFLTLNSLAGSSQSYQYLRIIADTTFNLDIVEMSWIVGTTNYPTVPMTSWTAPSPLEVTGDNANWERFRLYDDTGADTRLGTISSDPDIFRQYTLDLGSGNGILPDSFFIQKTAWGVLAHFRIELSEDLIEWDSYLDTMVASPAWSMAVFPLRLIVDSTPPSIPENLVVAKHVEERVRLEWDPSKDDKRVEQYYIYRDGSLIDSSANAYYSDGGVSANTTYDYHIEALDKAGNRSMASDTLSHATRTMDSGPPTLNGSITVQSLQSTMARITWPAATDDQGIAGYIMHIDGVDEGVSSDAEFTFSGLRPETSYTIGVYAKDLMGNESSSLTYTITTPQYQGDMLIGTNFWNQEWSIFSNQLFINGYQNVVGPQPWKPALLEELIYANTLRFMEMQQINRDAEFDWHFRKQKDNINQDELAFEWMIDLCNRNDSHLWLCIPKEVIHRNRIDSGRQHYIKKLAVLVKTGIDLKDADLDLPIWDDLDKMTPFEICLHGGVKTCEPLHEDLKIYIEYGNENWNNSFPQRGYCNTEGQALGLGWNQWSAGSLFNAYASLTLFQEFEDVFGEDASRIETVLPIQSAGLFWAGRFLTDIFDLTSYNPSGIYPDIISGHTYFGHGLDGDDPNIDSLLRESIAEHTGEIRTLKDSVDSWSDSRGADIRLISYEGGHHTTINYDSLNMNPLIYDVYFDWLDSMNLFLEEIVVYSHVATNAFGLKNEVNQHISNAHKYRAIVYWLNQGVLPVDLISFEGEVKGQNIKLFWRTASEINTSHFVIERSTDGINYDSIGYQESTGGLNTITDYEMIDMAPLIGINYYRLKIIDIDGSMSNSPIIALPFDSTTRPADKWKKLKMYPNPTKRMIHIEMPEEDRKESMTLYDSRGKIVVQFETTPYYIPDYMMKRGIYYLIGRTYSGQFIKL